MDLQKLNRQGVLLLGCGKMGSALLGGWLQQGIRAESVSVLEPNPSEWLRACPVKLNQGLPDDPPAVCLLAIKPQVVGAALERVRAVGGGETVVISIIAGLPIAYLESVFGDATPIVRAMPNTPAAIGCGISALFGNRASGASELALVEELMAAVGDTVRLASEELMDAVTAVSGSGPAYVFHLIEAMAEAGMQLGFDADIAGKLAVATVAGAGQLARTASRSPGQLRDDVTSPGGTTAAALQHLMDPATGLRQLMARSIRAAEARGRELGKLYG